ncbi:condensation domain-containing protein [Streptomyces sp. NPDC051907]|uniref:condensation domain-containing protein n=1 Tax=Streptomyces sp. NPDC051907 TaxID=3155284 RepID=UPI00342328F6
MSPQIPLSYAQRRLWFHYQMEGPSPTYNVPLVLRLAGTLDRAALADAVADVVARHESLRTVFPDVDGAPVQRVLDAAEARPALRARDVEPAGLAAALRQEAAHAFDLAVEPPIRTALLRTGPDEHVLLVLVHHIATDDWSTTPLTRQLSQAYTARLDGAPPAWEPLPVQYADFAVWQRDVLGEESDPDSEMAEHLAYWKQELTGAPELLSLPLDRPRPPVASGRGRRVPFGWDAGTQASLDALARETGTTVFMTVQAAVAELLTRLGAGTDIPLGAAFSGRTDESLDDLIGFFTNTLVLRTDTSGAPTFRQLVLRTRETNLSAHAHQDCPFDRLVDALKPARSLGHHPLFQVMLAYQNAGRNDLSLPGLSVVVEEIDTEAAKFDLALVFSEGGPVAAPAGPSGMTGSLHYAADLFDESTAKTMTERLVRLVRAAAADPDRPLSRVDVLSAPERALLLTEWNDIDGQVEALWAAHAFPAAGGTSEP